MFTLKKPIICGLIFIMLLSMTLTGCGGKSSSSKGSGKVIEAYFLAPKCKDLNLVQDEVNKILKDKIGATIKLNYLYWDSYEDKQKLLLAKGTGVDLMFAPSWYGFSNFVAQKAFLELDSLLDKYGKDITKNIPPAYLQAPRSGGKLYGIPTSKDMAGVGGLLANKELVDKYKFDLTSIKKPEDIEPMLKVIKEKEPGITPFLSTKGDQTSYFLQDFYENIVQANVPVGLKKVEGKPTVYNLSETPEYIEIVKLTESWYKKGYINSDVATLKDATSYKNNKKAFMWGEQLKPGKDNEMKAQLGYDVVQINAHAGIRPFANTGDLTNSMFAIPRNAKNPEEAMKFINEMFCNKELKNLLSWGIEKKHYKKIGDNKIDFADGVTAKTSGYTGIPQWAMGGSQFLDYLWKTEDDKKWDKMKEFNESAIISPTVGWIFDQTKVKTEVSAVATVGKEHGEAIASGIVSYDTQYPKMKKALDSAGMDKILKEAQSQIDEFVKNKK